MDKYVLTKWDDTKDLLWARVTGSYWGNRQRMFRVAMRDGTSEVVMKSQVVKSVEAGGFPRGK